MYYPEEDYSQFELEEEIEDYKRRHKKGVFYLDDGDFEKILADGLRDGIYDNNPRLRKSIESVLDHGQPRQYYY